MPVQTMEEVINRLSEWVANERRSAFNEGYEAAKKASAEIALAIDSCRGNEKLIAEAISQLKRVK